MDRRRPCAASGALAFALAALFVGVVVAVDPHGLVPSGPARWTVTAVIMGVAVCVLFLRAGPRRARDGCALAGARWLVVRRRDRGRRLAARVDRHTRSAARLARVVHVPADVPVRPGAHDASAIGASCCAARRIAAARPRRCGASFERAGWSLIDESFAGASRRRSVRATRVRRRGCGVARADGRWRLRSTAANRGAWRVRRGVRRAGAGAALVAVADARRLVRASPSPLALLGAAAPRCRAPTLARDRSCDRRRGRRAVRGDAARRPGRRCVRARARHDAGAVRRLGGRRAGRRAPSGARRRARGISGRVPAGRLRGVRAAARNRGRFPIARTTAIIDVAASGGVVRRTALRGVAGRAPVAICVARAARARSGDDRARVRASSRTSCSSSSCSR